MTSCIFQIVALSAFVEQPSYSVDEATGNVEVCVALQGAMQINVSLSLITVDMSATGTFSRNIYSHNPL